jgi:DNA repair protein RecO (recombination protein O)
MGLSRPSDEDGRRGNVAKSIILKKYDFGEADELVVFLSRELGWLRGVAKNAKKSRIRFGGHLEPLSLVDFTLRPRKRDDLVWIDESQVIRCLLADQIRHLQGGRALRILSFVQFSCPRTIPDPALFDFTLNFLESPE